MYPRIQAPAWIRRGFQAGAWKPELMMWAWKPEM